MSLSLSTCYFTMDTDYLISHTLVCLLVCNWRVDKGLLGQHNDERMSDIKHSNGSLVKSV